MAKMTEDDGGGGGLKTPNFRFLDATSFVNAPLVRVRIRLGLW